MFIFSLGGLTPVLQWKRSRKPSIYKGFQTWYRMKSPSVSVGWHRCFTRSFRRFECLGLFDFKPGHEPVELLPGQLFYFQLISGPAESALDFHTFIQQHKSVRFPEQSFDPVTTFSTEKIQGTSSWIHMELILYNSTQPVNGFPHIRSACYDIDFIGGCDIP